jgi:pimeloyl-ACP methyl ester carboxylesterase
MEWRCAGLLALLTLAACSSGDDDESMDAAVSMDAVPDAGFEDIGPRPDLGIQPDTGVDAGFADPSTVVMGTEMVAGTRTFVHVRGTVTSTLPPLVMLPTGPHQGGVSGFFGHFGGGIGHEYLPEHMDFLLSGRLLIYFDFKATGRTGFGSVGSSTLSVGLHVEQVGEILDWAAEKLEVDTTSVDIFGHGYGAGVGALYAAAQPSRVNRLVLVDPMAPQVDQYAQAIADLQARLTTSDRQMLDTFTREPECIGDTSQCTIEVWRILAPRLGCTGNESRVNTLMFAYAEVRAFDYLRRDLTEDRYNWSTLFPLITAETTIISGPCDATPPEAALTYTASISGAVHEILNGTGHWPMVEDSIAFQRAVSAALRYP